MFLFQFVKHIIEKVIEIYEILLIWWVDLQYPWSQGIGSPVWGSSMTRVNMSVQYSASMPNYDDSNPSNVANTISVIECDCDTRVKQKRCVNIPCSRYLRIRVFSHDVSTSHSPCETCTVNEHNGVVNSSADMTETTRHDLYILNKVFEGVCKYCEMEYFIAINSAKSICYIRCTKIPHYDDYDLSEASTIGLDIKCDIRLLETYHWDSRNLSKVSCNDELLSVFNFKRILINCSGSLAQDRKYYPGSFTMNFCLYDCEEYLYIYEHVCARCMNNQSIVMTTCDARLPVHIVWKIRCAYSVASEDTVMHTITMVCKHTLHHYRRHSDFYVCLHGRTIESPGGESAPAVIRRHSDPPVCLHRESSEAGLEVFVFEVTQLPLYAGATCCMPCNSFCVININSLVYDEVIRHMINLLHIGMCTLCLIMIRLLLWLRINIVCPGTCKLIRQPSCNSRCRHDVVNTRWRSLGVNVLIMWSIIKLSMLLCNCYIGYVSVLARFAKTRDICHCAAQVFLYMTTLIVMVYFELTTQLAQMVYDKVCTHLIIKLRTSWGWSSIWFGTCKLIENLCCNSRCLYDVISIVRRPLVVRYHLNRITAGISCNIVLNHSLLDDMVLPCTTKQWVQRLAHRMYVNGISNSC